MKFPLKLSSGLIVSSIVVFFSLGYIATTQQQMTKATQWYWPESKIGSSGENVYTIQYMLRERGIAITPNGQFDAATEQAVKIFQRAKGLKVNGVVDAATWVQLIVTTRQGDSGDAVTALQRQLQEKKDIAKTNQITVNGLFDAATTKLVKAFQQDISSEVNGIADLATWVTLLGGFGSFTGPTNIGPMPARVASIIKWAQSNLGTSYVFGGSCTDSHSSDLSKHCDCSSLVQMAYKRGGGLDLPRTTYDQINTGPRLSARQVQPGDLVFTSADHVLLYIGHVDGVGNNITINAPQTGDVVRYRPMPSNPFAVVRPKVLIQALNTAQ